MKNRLTRKTHITCGNEHTRGTFPQECPSKLVSEVFDGIRDGSRTLTQRDPLVPGSVQPPEAPKHEKKASTSTFSWNTKAKGNLNSNAKTSKTSIFYSHGLQVGGSWLRMKQANVTSARPTDEQRECTHQKQFRCGHQEG